MIKSPLKNINIPKIFFFFCVVFSIIITYFTTQICIDSDASSELVLAEHLSKTCQILSTDWFYSTELRVINTQLIYTPLFWIFDDWHMVRFFGALILQGILILSFYFYTHLLDIEKNTFYICSALYLLPVSVCYGRIALYNCYYIPHIVLSLIIVGLIFAKKNSRNPSSKCARLLSLFIVSFLGGLGGIRQLMMTHIPAILAVLIYYFIDDYINKSDDHVFERKRCAFIVRAVCSTFFSCIGFMINKLYFAQNYSFKDYSTNTIKILNESLDQVFYGYFHHFGFRDEIKLLSVTGVLSVLGVFLGIYCFIVSFYRIIRYKKEANVQNTLPFVFFIAYTVVMLFVFFIVGDGYSFVLYFTPIVIWMIPIFVLEMRNVPKHLSLLNLKKILPYIMVVIIFINGFVNSAFLISGKIFEQKYEGLGYKTYNARSYITPAVSFLQENGYDLGYAGFWNSNISTEISNGKIKMINLNMNFNDGTIYYYDWLTLKSNRSLVNKKKFILLSVDEYQKLTKNEELQKCEIVYRDDYYVIYDLTENDLFE